MMNDQTKLNRKTQIEFDLPRPLQKYRASIDK